MASGLWRVVGLEGSWLVGVRMVSDPPIAEDAMDGAPWVSAVREVMGRPL